MQNNKNSNTDDKIISLYKVIGIGSKDNFSIACNKINGLTAWITGPFIVLYDIKKDKQIKFIKNKNNKTFACLSFSSDGSYLACGEGNCKNGEIAIYEVTNDENQIQENKTKTIKSHKYGIEKLKFFKNDKYLVSIGDSEDKNIFIINTQTCETIFSSKYNRAIFSFDICDSFMILGGEKFLKLWNLDEVDNKKLVVSKNNIDMGKLKDKVFFSAAIYINEASSEKKAFLITSDGHLLEVKCSTKQITRWMHLKTDKSLSICINDTNVICGCSDGIIRVFKADNFEHVMTLHRPPPLGKANIDSNIKKINISVSQDEKFADIVIVSYNSIHDKLISIYSDKTFFIWDIKKTEKIYVYRYNSFHSGSINNMDIQVTDDDILKISTCSDDKTVKLWNFKLEDFGVQNPFFYNPRKIPHIAYSKILRRIFYFGKGYSHFKFDVEGYIAGSGKINNNMNININNPDYISDELDDIEISTVKFTPDNQYIVFGDNIGNIYIYSLTSFEKVNYASVHNAQITCIDIIRKDKTYLLATGSMDNLITVFDISTGIDKNFENLERSVIEDHLAPVTNVLFCVDRLNNLKLVSCSADRSINFYLFQSATQIQLLQRFQEDDINTYCLAFNPMNKQIIAGHNGKLTMWKSKIFTCQKIFQMKRGENFLDNFRIAVDKTGTIIAISNNDKYIRIRSTIDGHLFTKIPIAESISSLHFAINNNFLIASSVEGYIYFFKIDINLISIPILKEIEEKKKVKNKLKLIERYLQNDSSKNKHENVKALIERIQNSEEEFNFEDVKLLNSYFDEKEKLNQDINNANQITEEEDIKFVNKIDLSLKSKDIDDSHKHISKGVNSAVIEIKEEKFNNENDEDNNNNKDLLINQDNFIKNSFMTKSNIFEKNLKELPGEALKKSILNKSRISLTENFLKMKENKDIHIPKNNFIENIFKKAEKSPSETKTLNNFINAQISSGGETQTTRLEEKKITSEIPFSFNKVYKLTNNQNEAAVSSNEDSKEKDIKDENLLKRNDIPNLPSKNLTQNDLDANKICDLKHTSNVITEVNNLVNVNLNTAINISENTNQKITFEKEMEANNDSNSNSNQTNQNNILNSNFFIRKPIANINNVIEVKEKKLQNPNFPKKNNNREREISVSNTALNEIQQIISNTNKLVGDIQTKVYNTNEITKNKKEQNEDKDEDYDYFTNEDRLSLAGKEFEMRNLNKAGNIFKKNLQEQIETVSSIPKEKEGATEIDSEELKINNKFTNIKIDEDIKEKNTLYEIAEELQFEDMSELNNQKEQTLNYDVSDSLMNKDKFLPDIIDNTFLYSHRNNHNAYASQTDTFFNDTNKEINGNFIDKTVSAVFTLDENISNLNLGLIMKESSLIANLKAKDINTIVKENNFLLRPEKEISEFKFDSFKNQIFLAEDFIENGEKDCEADTKQFLEIKKMIENLNDKIDMKLNLRKEPKNELIKLIEENEKVDDNIIEKYLEKYSTLLIKRIEEKINK